jgi:hypothetical protein
MGWESRGNGWFYYTKHRERGRVVSRYLGRGLLGKCASVLAEQEHAQRAAWRAQHDAERTKHTAGDALARESEAEAHQLTRLLLLASGHHRHKGTWRKRRGEPMPRTKMPVAELPPLPTLGDTSPAAMRPILQRCDRRDASSHDLAALRTLLLHKPDLARIGNLLRASLDMLPIGGEGLKNANAFTREMITAWVAERRHALGYATAPALEQPLLDHLILCEQRLGLTENLYLQHLALPEFHADAPTSGGSTSAGYRRH